MDQRPPRAAFADTRDAGARILPERRQCSIMLSLRICLAAALAALALPGAEGEAIAPGNRTIVLFNGRDLTNFYTYLETSKYEDPKKVFTVQNGLLRISGEEWGGLTTKQAYRDYHLVAEWKWGGKVFEPRAQRARDSGILLHGVGRDGAAANKWLESIECQIIEGGCGDIILVGGAGRPSLTVETRTGPDGQLYWQKGGKPETRDRGRFNWFGRDPGWKDVLGFRGARDLEKPTGQWNRSEAICHGDSITTIVNGVVAVEGSRASPTQGKIQIQSEGAEILFRKIELRPLQRRRGSR